jgi:hypothetical protein
VTDAAAEYYCNRVIRTITTISRSMMQLHGRDLYNMFALYGAELQQDVYDLVSQRWMGVDLRPLSLGDRVAVPGMAAKNCRRMRYMWDYFIFIYMSHKIQNIIARQSKSDPTGHPILVYLRGTDYQLAITREGAAVGHSTMEDFHFGASILAPLEDRFRVIKALSPSDLSWAMKDIGFFFARHGNNLHAVAEFARAYGGGFFMNPVNWKERVAQLLPSASLFLVYVSNQSNGLAYELECLAAAGMEDHAILVLDERRFGSREPFFALQDRLNEAGEHLYLSVDRNACAVDDPARFEQLVSSFPHRISLGEDSQQALREIEALIPLALNPAAAPAAEFPFEFEPPLSPGEAEEVEAIRRDLREFIDQALAAETFSNWPVLLLYLELDIFFGVAFGDILASAISAGRYAAIADFTRDLISRKAPERVADLDPALERCGDTAMNIAYQAFAMGEWNDYGDRRALAKAEVDSAAGRVSSLMERSVESASALFLREPRPEAPAKDPSTYSALLSSLLDSSKDIEGGEP